LYGAGKVGKDYYDQFSRYKKIRLVAWVDINWETIVKDYFEIVSPKEIKTINFDYVVIAVDRINLADEIRTFLIENGVSGKKILWNRPVDIGEFG